MFPVVSSLPRVRGQLRALRLSLNTPVVTIEDLPVGPAVAGIALHAGPEGLRLTLAVRSVRAGHVAFFHPDEDWSEIHGSELAVEAALSFAECMGFLFDDDPIEAGGDVREAARRWAELVETAGAEEPAEPLGEEIWLEEVAPVAPAPLLSKFRFLAAESPERRTAAPLQAELPPRGGLWLRLLSRF
ncbi:MAG: hypothetical protein ACYS1E_19095 [Planctomycetota bacterium]|jgi:hypothetical protein